MAERGFLPERKKASVFFSSFFHKSTWKLWKIREPENLQFIL